MQDTLTNIISYLAPIGKRSGLLVVFSMDEMISQIKFRTQLFEMENDEKVA